MNNIAKRILGQKITLLALSLCITTSIYGETNANLNKPVKKTTQQSNQPKRVIGLSSIEECTDRVYSLKIDNIKISYNGIDIDHSVANPGVVGNGFLIDNGNFVTARQNVQPWIYNGVLQDGEWRRQLAWYFACGCDIEIQYSAYSSTGAGKKLIFSSRDFEHPTDYITTEIEIPKTIRVQLKKYGFKITYTKSAYRTYSQFADTSASYAVLRNMQKSGIPTSNSSLEGGHQLKIAGFDGKTDIHNLTSFRYLTSTTEYKDDNNGTIILQDGNYNDGFLGSPAFIQNSDKSYSVIGVYVGMMFDRPRIVPISKCR